MSAYHEDKCTVEDLRLFRQKVLDFLNSEGIKPHKVTAFRSYNGEIRLYKSEPALRLRLRMGRKMVAFKNPGGTYEGDSEESIAMLKRSGGDQLWESTNDPIPCANYTQVFRVDDWEEEKKAIRDFFEVIK